LFLFSFVILEIKGYASSFEYRQGEFMKLLMIVTILSMAFTFSISAAYASETTCKGDAQSSAPPVPNYPTHIRNVVWRNTRALCLAEQSQGVSHFSQAPTPLPKKAVNQRPVEQKAVN
jgi:hypothetical protein